jgi:DNA-binding transcriptional ArsR family regulator
MKPRALLPDEMLEQAADCLRTLAHPVRLRIVELLSLGSVPVTELAETIGLPQAAVSQHLSLMKAHGLLSSHREGRRVFYELDHPQCATVLQCMQTQSNAQRAGSARKKTKKR